MKSANICKSGSVCLIANARVLGSYQADALQNISGALGFRPIDDTSTAFWTGVVDGVFHVRGVSGTNVLGFQKADRTFGKARDELTFDASRVARTSSETRSSNTAMAPRIIAF